MRKLSSVDIIEVFVYTVVLCTFTQLFPAVISESFLTSLATAVLLKLVLEAVVSMKGRIISRLKNANTVRVRIVSITTLALLGGGSKALILWLTDVLLGDAVYLGGFFAVTLLVVTMMLARLGVRAVLKAAP